MSPALAKASSQKLRIEIRELERDDRAWAKSFLEEQAGSARVVSRGKLHQAQELPGHVAQVTRDRVGLLTYYLAGEELEVVTLHAALRGCGVGTRFLEAAMGKAREAGCRRLWLITTNDNDPAMAFYRSRGMTLAAIHRGAIAVSRKLKPDIPLYGVNGTRIEDELEFEVRLGPAGGVAS